jgi:DNA-binding NtrC family response regulator
MGINYFSGMQLRNAKILVVDDDRDVLTAMRLLLKEHVKEVFTVTNPETIKSLVSPGAFDLVILDMNFKSQINTGNEGLFWLNKIRSLDVNLPVILITAYGDIDLAIRSLKESASDFIVKPWKNDKLIHVLKEVLRTKKSKTAKYLSPNFPGVKIIGQSTPMQEIFLKIDKVGPTDANILLLGENGTGKDLLAKAIHESSNRKSAPFVKVDVGSLTESLFESELFGYKKGAFTDAREDRQGRFEVANGGTLFLDEIANIPLHQQARLLSVLQNRQVTPLGSTESIPIDIRLICATNVKISDLADEKRFRKDLIYRINTVEINLPPLREREQDVIHLANYYVDHYAEKYLKSKIEMDEGFKNKLESYRFPGNIRELQYAIERAVIMADTKTLFEKDLVFSPIEKYMGSSKEETTNLDEVERNTIAKVIAKNKGNISKSAKDLGITRTALYRRIEKYGL